MLYRTLLKMWFLPPMFNIVLIAVGLLLLHRYRKLGIACCALGLGSLLLFSTPQISNIMLKSIEVANAIVPAQIVGLENTAIVVLGAGQIENVQEYGVTQPNHDAVARLTYGAYLHRKTGLPLLLTGGKPSSSAMAHAQVQANYMQQHLHVKPTWLETQSRTTWENATQSAEILFAKNIRRVVLVTQSVHMRRSVLLFKAAGFEVVPAATELSFTNSPVLQWWRWLPTSESLRKASMVLHEALGYAWYQLCSLNERTFRS